jgi:hypothetical protein
MLEATLEQIVPPFVLVNPLYRPKGTFSMPRDLNRAEYMKWFNQTPKGPLVPYQTLPWNLPKFQIGSQFSNFGYVEPPTESR